MENIDNNFFVVFNKAEKQFQVGKTIGEDSEFMLIESKFYDKKSIVMIRSGKKLNMNELRCNFRIKEEAVHKLPMEDINSILEYYNYNFIETKNKERKDTEKESSR